MKWVHKVTRNSKAIDRSMRNWLLFILPLLVNGLILYFIEKPGLVSVSNIEFQQFICNV